MTEGTTTDATAPTPEVAGDLAAIATIERDLQAVDSALRRLDEGAYGTCSSCGRSIEAGLLGQDPLRSRCAGCDSGQGRLPIL
jgi:DnaK suppressor protein